MKTLHFSGASDDLFECEGDFREEINCGDDLAIYKVATATESLLVIGLYAPKGVPEGTWIVGVTNEADGTPIPEWPIKLGNPDRHLYSPMVTLEVPDDAVVTIFGGPKED